MAKADQINPTYTICEGRCSCKIYMREVSRLYLNWDKK